MAELAKNQVFLPNIEVLSISEYAEKFGHGIQKQSVYNAISQGKIDYIPLGREKFVVMTPRTRQYTPNSHPNRQHARPVRKK